MKGIFLTLTAITMLCSHNASAQAFGWVEQIGTPCSSMYSASCIAINGAGNVYVAGEFPFSADFDPGAGVFNLPVSGTIDMFIQKLTASGALIWATSIGGTASYIYTSSIAVDASDNLYITGVFSGTVDFDPGIGISSFYSPAPESSMFVLKLNSTGAFQWVKVMVGAAPSSIASTCMKIDASNNIYISGAFSGLIDFSPDATVNDTITSYGMNDIFVLKLNAMGDLVWVKRVGTTTDDNSQSLALDGLGNLYYIGMYRSTIDVDPGIGSYLFYCSGSIETFFSKMDTAGNFIWAKQLRGTTSATFVQARDIGIDATKHLVLGGSFGGTIDFDPSVPGYYPLSSGTHSSAAFVMRTDAGGNFLWAKNVDGGSITNRLSLDLASNIYSLGLYTDTPNDFNPGPAVYGLPVLVNTVLDNTYVQRLDSTGHFDWAIGISGLDNVWGKAMAVNDTGDVYFSGFFKDTADFDPGPGIHIQGAGLGIYNPGCAFVEKLNNVPPLKTLNVLSSWFVNVYPNPTDKNVNIKSDAELIEVTVTDMIGRIIVQSHPYSKNEKIELQYPGLYLVNILSTEGTIVKKVLVSP